MFLQDRCSYSVFSLEFPAISPKLACQYLDTIPYRSIVCRCGEIWGKVGFWDFYPKLAPLQGKYTSIKMPLRRLLGEGCTLFRGINEINMDAKGRMAIPSRYRELITSHSNGQLVATIDIQDSCLRIYPLPVWEELEAKLEGLPSTNRDVRRIQRLVLGYASDLEMDASGRVLFPTSLRKFANLEKKLVLVGQGQKLELWSEDKWACCLDDAVADGSELPVEIDSIPF